MGPLPNHVVIFKQILAHVKFFINTIRYWTLNRPRKYKTSMSIFLANLLGNRPTRLVHLNKTKVITISTAMSRLFCCKTSIYEALSASHCGLPKYWIKSEIKRYFQTADCHHQQDTQFCFIWVRKCSPLRFFLYVKPLFRNRPVKRTSNLQLDRRHVTQP